MYYSVFLTAGCPVEQQNLFTVSAGMIHLPVACSGSGIHSGELGIATYVCQCRVFIMYSVCKQVGF
jgi:hypothetical protein